MALAPERAAADDEADADAFEETESPGAAVDTAFPTGNERQAVDVWENQRWGILDQQFSGSHVCVHASSDGRDGGAAVDDRPSTLHVHERRRGGRGEGAGLWSAACSRRTNS